MVAVVLGATDQTSVATALPRIAEDLGGVSRYAWIATAYLLASTVLVPTYGKLADTVPLRSLLLFALIVFLGGSVASAAAGVVDRLPLVGDGMNQLIAARALQGVGGAGLFSLASISLAALFTPRERGRYQGYVGAAFALAVIVGPLIGGLLTDHAGGLVPGIAGWRWIFLVNVPLGLVLWWFVASRMPPLRPPRDHHAVGFVSPLLMVGTIAPLVLGLQLDKLAYPWSGGVTLSLLGLACVAGIAFAWHARHAGNPMFEPSQFRDRTFASGMAVNLFVGAVLVSTVLFLPLYLVHVSSASATGAGLALMPLSLAAVAAAIVAGQVTARTGRYRPLLIGGAVLVAAAMGLLATLDVETPRRTLTVFMVVAGLGIGPTLPLVTLAIQNAAPPGLVGQATGASQFARQIGGVLGAALAGTLFTSSLLGGLAIPLGSDAHATVERAVRAGGAEADRELRRLVDEEVDELVAATAAGDVDRIAAVLERTPLPFGTRQLFLGEAAAAGGDPDRVAAFAGEVRALVREREAEILAALRADVREAFAGGIAVVFRALTVAAAAALAATLFVPVRPLRSRRRGAEPSGAGDGGG